MDSCKIKIGLNPFFMVLIPFMVITPGWTFSEMMLVEL